MNFCTECGHPLGDQHQFCTNCGAKQESADSSTSGQASDQPLHDQTEHRPPPQQPSRSASKSTINKPPNKPMKKRTKILLISAAAVVVVLFGTHMGLQAYFDPMDDLQAMDQAAAEDDAATFTSYIDFTDDRLLDKQAYLAYIQTNEWDSAKKQYRQLIEEGNDLTRDITDRNGSTLFTVQPDDHLLGLYTTYSLKAQPTELTMTTPLEDTEMTIDEETTTGSPDDPGRFKAYPGTYDLNAKASNAYGDFAIDHSLEIESQQAYELNLDFTGDTYDFRTNHKDAILFINGEETGQKLGELDELGPIPDDSDIKMHAEWTTPDGDVIKSNTVTPDDNKMFGVIPFSFAENEDTNKHARNTILDFRSDYEKALNSKDYSQIASYIQSGSEAESELKEYIGDLEDKGYNYNFTANSVQDVETIDEETLEVTSREQFIFTNHRGKTTDYDRIKTYTVTTTNDAYEISSIDYDETNRDEN
ncbi:hypothetical protein GCM10028778_07400 [Barrientosiimonas marina]|uniref:Zinc-ribbon domain-containing protein n=1 Tax=Lentibacillus kimchii TaxID=1542911 RepID=A0ABW2UYH3_9BACI